MLQRRNQTGLDDLLMASTIGPDGLPLDREIPPDEGDEIDEISPLEYLGQGRARAYRGRHDLGIVTSDELPEWIPDLGAVIDGAWLGGDYVLQAL